MATGTVKNGTPKPCKHCESVFKPTSRAQRYCLDCRELLNCVSCGNPLNVHFNRVAERRRKCNECYRREDATGRFTTQRGYIYVKDPLDERSYIPEHRLIMEQMLGRRLTIMEVVHHKNKMPNDNRPENLVLCANLREHLDTYHRENLVPPPVHHNGRRLIPGSKRWRRRQRQDNKQTTCPFWSGR